MLDSKPQDDKRFLRDEDEQSKEEQEKKKERIPIQLPEIEHPLQKETPPEKDLKQEPKQEKIEPSPALTSEEKPKPPKRQKIPFIYLLTGLLVISFLANIFLYYNVSKLKRKTISSTKLVENVITDKEKASQEKEFLKKDNARLERELETAANTNEGLRRQNNTLKTELAKNKEKYSELEKTAKGYDEELKQLAVKRTGYYDAYLEEKENVNQLNLTIKNLQDKINNFGAEMGSVSDGFKEKEAKYVYDMAFLYVKANMFEQALDSFKKFIELHGEDADIHYNIAYIYEHIKKDKDKAIEHYQKYLMLKPDAEDLFEVKVKVSSMQRGIKGERSSKVDEAKYLIERADRLYNEMRYEEADRLYEEVLENLKY